MTTKDDEVYLGSDVWVTRSVTLNVPISDDITVAISVRRLATDEHVWLPAAWEGDEGMTRRCRTVDTIEFTEPTWKTTLYNVFVKVTDNPEAPIIPAGKLTVKR